MKNSIYLKYSRTELVSTNFWDTEMSKKYSLVSCNAGCMNLLLPNCCISQLPDMLKCDYAIVSLTRQDSPKVMAMGILFEDHSKSPYCLQLTFKSCFPFPLTDEKYMEHKLSIWASRLNKIVEIPMYLR